MNCLRCGCTNLPKKADYCIDCAIVLSRTTHSEIMEQYKTITMLQYFKRKIANFLNNNSIIILSRIDKE